MIELGIEHEQQHQELLLMDIKFIFFQNPLRPVYRPYESSSPAKSCTQVWHDYSPGLCEIGHRNHSFSYDHEGPRHQIFLQDYRLASRLITQGEYLEFMQAGGYQNPLYWLSDGWDWVGQNRVDAPLYWEKVEGKWMVMTLSGMKSPHEHDPVSHISFYEADAYARWAGKRLPTEGEWEHAASSLEVSGHFMENEIFQPQGPSTQPHGREPQQIYGDLWEWTVSAFLAYPGFKALEGPAREYNGKFMCNQKVLRGGACVSPQSHLRATYRNFYYPNQRWMFSGVRLAEDLS